MLRDGLSLAASGGFASLRDIGIYHAQRILQSNGRSSEDSQQGAEQVVAGFQEVRPHEDVAEGLAALASLGIQVQLCPCLRSAAQLHQISASQQMARIGSQSADHATGEVQLSTMTNGSKAVTKGFLDRADIGSFVKEDDLMDVAQPQIWKPAPGAYTYAVKHLRCSPDEVRPSAFYVQPWAQKGDCMIDCQLQLVHAVAGPSQPEAQQAQHRADNLSVMESSPFLHVVGAAGCCPSLGLQWR